MPATTAPAPKARPAAIDPQHTLLNATQLAQALGRDRAFITAMRAAGFTLALGGYTTVQDALTWLRENPTFKRPPRGRPRR